VIIRFWGVMAAVLLLAGCPVPQIQSGATVTPDKLPAKVPELVKYADDILTKAKANDGGGSSNMENALVALDKALKLEPRNYEVAWRAARACEWLAGDWYDDKTRRAHFAQRGADYAKTAIAIDPKRVEGHYYSGTNLGLSATTKTIGAKFMVPSVRDAAKKALQIDPSYEHGGPPRLLGSLYAQAPPWPASIGDPDKGVELLEQALKIDGAYPLNNLLLADALVRAEKFDEAKKQYQAVLDAQPRSDDAHSLKKWKSLAKKGMDEANKKGASALNASPPPPPPPPPH
jgi:tetratricopeptide (TPR) repeat protein